MKQKIINTNLFITIAIMMNCTVGNSFDIHNYFPDFDEKSSIYRAISKRVTDEKYGENGRIDELSGELISAVSDNNKTASDYFIIGNMLFAMDLKLSIWHMKKAEKLSKNNPLIEYERAIQEHQNKNCKKAVKYYDSFFKSDFGKGHKMAHARATDCYLRTNRYKDAVDSWIVSDHGNKHVEIEKVIYSMYGGEPYYSKRNKLLRKIIKDDEIGLFPKLISMDLSWKIDWWNIDINEKHLNHDLALAKQLLSSKKYNELLVLKHLEKKDLAQEEILKMMRDTGLWSEHSKLPESSIIMYKVIFYLTKNKIVTSKQLKERFEKELRERVFSESIHTKNLDILAFIYSETDQKKLIEIDELGWKKHHLVNYARSRLVGEDNEKKYNKLFKKISKEFPYDPEFAMMRLKFNKDNKKESELMAKVVAAEFPNVEKVYDSYRLKGYIYSLAKQIKHPVAKGKYRK